jgi:hypothetical protein
MATGTMKKLHSRKVSESTQNREATDPEKEPIHCLQASPSDDSQARIAQRAYELYLERGSRAGYALNDWLDAERDVLDLECNA